jgi:Na(+)-translocating NADH:ubiquinone oxidoreductase B subunit
MKLMRSFFDRIKPFFEKDGSLELFYPVYSMFDNMMFLSNQKTANSPFGRDPIDIKRYMFLVIIGLMPCFLGAIYFFGIRYFYMLIVAYAAGAVVEILFAIVRKEEVNEGFLVSGFIFPLILPPGIPLWLVAVGIVFGTLVGKEVFGGTGRNIFNPALVGRCFLALGYPSAMSGSWVSPGSGLLGNILTNYKLSAPDSVTMATPLVQARSGIYAPLKDLFFGNVMGSSGETSAILVILGGLFIIAVGVSSWRTVLSIILSFTGFNLLFNLINPGVANPVLFNILSGGFLFGAFFMATDPISSPTTISAKWGYGILIGFLALLIRTFSGFVEGMMFAILLGNIFAPLFDEVVIRMRMKKYAEKH